MNVDLLRATRVALLAASSASALAFSSSALAADVGLNANQANAAEALRSMVGGGFTLTPDIITNDGPDITPGPGSAATGTNYANSPQVLDAPGINGIGQMISFQQSSPTGAGLLLCTGTLINPRTVLTAAHCVYDLPKQYYGSNTGVGDGVNGPFSSTGATLTSNGVPLSFGFSSTNRCRGVAVNGCAVGQGPYEAWRDSNFQTVASKAIYNANQVWYGTGAQPTELGGGGEFANEDIALVTLDTHASGIPTWSLLFSPLSGPTHVTITGYGNAGVGTSGHGNLAGIDYRRRSAENMIDALFTLNDFVDSPAIAPGDTSYSAYNHSLYWMDFDDPNYDPNNLPANFFAGGNPRNSYFNFNGLGGTALPHEGTTGGGDSGGPLIADQTFRNPDGSFKPIVVGTLTGSFSFDGGTGLYGEFSVYPPLFLYWQEIVANNPYKYVSAKAGNGDWFDPTHWVQDMDPAYQTIDANGNLVNLLPDTPQGGADGAVDKFGTLCFLGDSCKDFASNDAPTGSGTPILTAGGPGSTNFVPNNVEPVNSLDPTLYKQAHYYDVTLRQAGRTTLGASATIDKLTLNGPAFLNITDTGNLKVWAEYNQFEGITNVDGVLKTGEAMQLDGFISGHGTFDPTYLTVVGGYLAPGSITPSGQAPVGTLTVKGDVILASASTLAIDLMKTKGDLLNVVGDTDNAGILALNGGTVLFGQGNGAAVKSGQSFTIATAQGGVAGVFGTTASSLGVLVPTVSYTPNSVLVSLQAGSLAAYLAGSNATALAFASALDTLRAGHYSNLSSFYDNVDLMSRNAMAATFNAISPTNLVNETQLLQDRQSRQLFGNVTDRLSMIATGQARGITFSGQAEGLSRNRNSLSASAQLGLTNTSQTMTAPMGKLSGFVTMSNDHVAASYGDSRSSLDQGQHSRYFATGVEAPFGNVTVGSAIGYADSISQIGSDGAKSKLTQAAAYASMPIGKSAYVGGVVAAERASADTNRLSTDTTLTLDLSGATHSSRYMATAEAGFRTGLLNGLSFNPRVQIGYSRYALGGFTESGGETALALNGLKVNRLETRIGARLDGTTHIAGWTVRPQLQGDYVRLLSGAKNGLSVSFAAAPDYSFVLPLTNSGSGWLEAKGGVEISKGAFTLGLTGQSTMGDAPISDRRGLVQLGFSF